MIEANMRVDAIDEHPIRPILGLIQQLLIARSRRNSFIQAKRKRVGALGKQRHVVRTDKLKNVAASSRQLVESLIDGVAYTGDQFQSVLHKFANNLIRAIRGQVELRKDFVAHIRSE